jgi:LacI family transcriptional regulator
MALSVIEKNDSRNRNKRRDIGVVDEIRQLATSVPTGNKFLPVRELMKRYSVGQSVIEKALAVLKGEGLLESKERSGLFVKSNEKSGTKMIDLFFFEGKTNISEGSFYYYFLGELASVFSEYDFSLRINCIEKNKCDEEFITTLKRKKVHIAILVGLRDIAFAQQLETQHIPYVHVFPNINTPLKNSIVLDSEYTFNCIFDHLIELGHRNIALLHGKRADIYQRDAWQRYEMFYKCAAERGILIRPEWVRFSGNGNAYKEMKAILEAGEIPTAVIAIDGAEHGVYKAIIESGKSVGKDISVVGFDDMPWAKHMIPSLTTVKNAMVEESKMIVDLVRDVLSGKILEQISMKLSLTKRCSTCSCEIKEF